MFGVGLIDFEVPSDHVYQRNSANVCPRWSYEQRLDAIWRCRHVDGVTQEYGDTHWWGVVQRKVSVPGRWHLRVAEKELSQMELRRFRRSAAATPEWFRGMTI
jgi:hypothetical protein